MESTSAIIISNCENMYTVANETCCLSIGVKLKEAARPDFQVEETSHILSVVHKINDMYLTISAHIRSKKKAHKPLIVGINGVDTSGKTMFSTELSTYLKKQGIPSQIIRIDDFHNESKIRYSEPNEVVSYYNHAFNLEKLESELLNPIREKATLMVNYYT